MKMLILDNFIKKEQVPPQGLLFSLGIITIDL